MDGVSQNFGKERGLHQLTNDFSERGNIGIHCYADRLQFASAKPGAIEGNCDLRKFYLIFIKSLVGHQNDMQSSGRQQKHIGTHALSLLTRHKKAKWVAVDERALTKLLRSWPALIQDRLEFAASRSLDTNTIRLQLISRKFLSYAHFVENVHAECRSLQKNLNWNRDLNFLQKTMLRRGFQWDEGSNGKMG